ncbi:MAG: AAA domain-containing protein [Lachnospiraceae bacterium]|nr:AAA domain-containing protein [Lachnospiraceae bacterium]
MDGTKFMVVAKSEIVTNKVVSCNRNSDTSKYDITFDNGSTYSYAQKNVMFMTNPKVIKPEDFIIETLNGKSLFDIRWIYEFTGKDEVYWHLVFNDFELNYKKDELVLRENCLMDTKSDRTFQYLKEVSELSNIKNDNNELVLRKYYEKIDFISDGTALSKFLNPESKLGTEKSKNIIFPFGCNQSQYKAVRNALENQISVIQGPPGTGKTQTILNIIANILINNKTVVVVSNNNSATLNVLEKLEKEKYGMDFLVTTLGNADNKAKFVAEQTGSYPDLSSWEQDADNMVSPDEVNQIADKLQRVYQLQEEVAKLKDRKYEIEIESKHFYEYVDDTGVDYNAIKVRGKMSSDRIMQLWQELQNRADQEKRFSIWAKLRSIFIFGIADWNFYKQDLAKIISVLQGMYYKQSLAEICEEISEKERELKNSRGDYDKQLEEKSLTYLKTIIASRYRWKEKRTLFTEDDLYKNSKHVLEEYPIVLSTAFSARTSLNARDVEFDYVIMDEASQVDISTGSLALSCAKHAVIVGDLKQLPNVVDNDTHQKADLIREKYVIDAAYDFANKSFLQSIVEAIPSVPQTLLREHYRCHPRIISFCNQKFYNNELVIMTEDDELNKSLMAIKTAEGNHRRGNYNQRQIDIIKTEILPAIDTPFNEIGIITPYNEQVNEIRKQIPNIDVATVHKFQGREKDVIILSTVDDQIKDFTDDPYLLNVAVSRAKKRLIIVVSGNEQEKEGNIIDLISYIQYNKLEVIDSQIFSVYDYLYSKYRNKRWEYLQKHRKISQYDSENLTFGLIHEALVDYPTYGVACFVPLSMVVKDLTALDDEEVRYAMNPGTHLDFLIFNKLSKQPVLAIETDGYYFHKDGTVQAERDKKKNHILESCGLRLLRLNTNGSQEKEKIIEELNK